jgi:hypothetical protein
MPLKTIKCHTERLFDCSPLSKGDRVIGNTLGIQGKTGTITRLTYEDCDGWKMIISMEVSMDDGTKINPYPHQLLKLVADEEEIKY